jgi:NADH-quinone oxidoreductase subunit E
VTPDGLFTVERVQCIGACELAPVIQVNGEFIGPVDEARLEDLITALRAKAREVAS